MKMIQENIADWEMARPTKFFFASRIYLTKLNELGIVIEWERKLL